MLANDKWTKRSSTAAWTTRRSQLCLDTQPRIPSHSALGSISQWSGRPRHAKPRSDLTRTASAGSEPTAGQSRSQPSSRNHARPPPPATRTQSVKSRAGRHTTDRTDQYRKLYRPPSAPTPAPRFPHRDLSTACPWHAETYDRPPDAGDRGFHFTCRPCPACPSTHPPCSYLRRKHHAGNCGNEATTAKQAGQTLLATLPDTRSCLAPSRNRHRAWAQHCARSLAYALPTCPCPLLPSHTRRPGFLALLLVPVPRTRTLRAPTPGSTNPR